MTEQQLTQSRDLRESQPLWLDSPRISVRTRNSPSMSHFDVIIVGAGISAALTAHALARPGQSMLIVDRREPVRGSSIASTAMIQHEIDIPLHKLQKMIGKEKAARAWQRSARAVLRLEEITRSLDISCSMRRKKTLYLAGDELGIRAMKNEVAQREKAGITAEFLSSEVLEETYGLMREGAILSDISASANPGQLTAGLLRDVVKRGAEIVSGVEITDLRNFGSDVVLATSDGKLLSASHVVFCTGYEFLKSLANKNHQIISTWALASRPQTSLPSWLKDHIVWEASDPYLYLRTDNHGRVIAGGEDEDDPEAFQSETKLKAKTDTIRVKLSKLLGKDIGAPEYRWAAAFGTTTTGLPLIGPVQGMDNVYAVMGFGGNGITFSQIAAEIISAAVNGGQDPDAELFAFA
ncbi:NAD(P)/FAD-dependent oxidoreductase [Agrobacterium sp. rho-13.3]|uniref:NAD(P)/FAD-dependent oxidoreductase n=1 Tax=Agrobacterium sp. rho-13.3 TaxID=3072980 RepID=UPI002A10D112|nr:FAD-binding oxidoreductase [Agrobacterium sp. rho-13.3]MDX8306658.1 FAD-binding oxidoreductase [Agrobacterium sp. rho-13.3]MDX8307011.1 FAD-binding oxidoreductase [Agrobacterium sp. rho-13.3]